jgi:hypothetical protein
MRRHPPYRPLLGLALLAAAGCASRAVVQGALSEEERREYVEQTGALIPFRLQQPFIQGIADTGMSREMVVFLYGNPDRTENDRYGLTWSAKPEPAPALADQRDSIWVYFDSDSATVKRGLVFGGDTVVRISGDLRK